VVEGRSLSAATLRYAFPQMSLPPGPTLHPAVQVVRWIRNPFHVMDECRARFGEAFTLRLPAIKGGLVVLSDPDDVKEVFALGPDEGHAGKANFVLRPFLGKHSLLLLDGAEHLRQRKMMLPAFHGERMTGYGHAMAELAHDSIDHWPIGTSFAVHRPMQAVTLQVIVRTVFGVGEGPRFSELADVLTRALDVGAWPGLLFPVLQRDLGRFSPWGRFVRLMRRAGEILRSEIRRGREKGTAGRTDVLAMLLEARDEAGQPLTEDEIHDELITLLVAGHETTATSLAWALRWILPDGALIARLREELAAAGGDPARIAKLELLDATVKESLRLQPIIPLVGRILQQPKRLGGRDLPAGTAIAPAIYLVHQRPSLYPDPQSFRPDRFLTFKPTPSEWLPFGGGLRRCIGAAFAIYEMKMVLASVLPRVEARLANQNVRTARRGVTLAPSGGLPIVVTARRPRPGVARAKAA
jgi:cytochrome P450